MLLYTLYQNTYRDVSYIEGAIKEKVYINVTNKCPCSCTFCLRQTKELLEGNTLWLKEDPSSEEIINELKKYNFEFTPEITFCGFGEPLENVDVVHDVAMYLKKMYPTLPLRVNTNGLGNQIHNENILPRLKGCIDTISISLNASNKEEYYRLTRSRFGIDSFDYMLDFAKEAKEYIPNVVVTVVDIIGEDEIKKCQQIADSIGVILRVRAFEK